MLYFQVQVLSQTLFVISLLSVPGCRATASPTAGGILGAGVKVDHMASAQGKSTKGH